MKLGKSRPYWYHRRVFFIIHCHITTPPSIRTLPPFFFFWTDRHTHSWKHIHSTLSPHEPAKACTREYKLTHAYTRTHNKFIHHLFNPSWIADVISKSKVVLHNQYIHHACKQKTLAAHSYSNLQVKNFVLCYKSNAFNTATQNVNHLTSQGKKNFKTANVYSNTPQEAILHMPFTISANESNHLN